MRNRAKTLASLRRLAERPGTKHEGDTARRMLERMGEWQGRAFDPAAFPPKTEVYYCYWCYRNERGIVRKPAPKKLQGQWWMLIKFDSLKSPRWVPVTSKLGCHIALRPFKGEEAEILYHMNAQDGTK